MVHWLQRAAAMHPERVALVDRGVEVTYAQLRERAWAASVALDELGVVAGDRVALALQGTDFIVALHGCWYASAVPVPIDARLGPEERAIRAQGAAALVDRPLVARPWGVVKIGFEADSIAAVLYTSGTTAAPRAVELTHGNFMWSAFGSALALGLDADERWLCPMPLVHVGGLSVPIRSAIYGTTAVLHERFDAATVCDALMDAAQRITVVSLVPTMLARLLDAGLRDPPTLRWALLGGGPIPEELLARARAAGVPVAPTYGMTEACSQIATHGWPLAGVEVHTASGEVVVRGPMVAPGALAGDGWLHTGDLGEFDRAGRLTIVGRKADTIVTGGENVAPAEVEAVLLAHPAIADAAVHPRPDPEWGEAVVATVVLRDPLSEVGPEELRNHCAARLASFKVPKEIAFANDLPRTASGKLIRSRL